jgi:hypothetical protein
VVPVARLTMSINALDVVVIQFERNRRHTAAIGDEFERTKQSRLRAPLREAQACLGDEEISPIPARSREVGVRQLDGVATVIE